MRFSPLSGAQHVPRRIPEHGVKARVRQRPALFIEIRLRKLQHPVKEAPVLRDRLPLASAAEQPSVSGSAECPFVTSSLSEENTAASGASASPGHIQQAHHRSAIVFQWFIFRSRSSRRSFSRTTSTGVVARFGEPAAFSDRASQRHFKICLGEEWCLNSLRGSRGLR